MIVNNERGHVSPWLAKSAGPGTSNHSLNYRPVSNTRFDGVGTHAPFEPITVAGNFRWVIPVHVLSDADWDTLLSGSNVRLSATSASHANPRSVWVQIEGAAPIDSGPDAYAVALTSVVSLVRNEDRISIEVDGVECAAASGPQFAVPLTFSCWGKNVSAQGGLDHFKGYYTAPARLFLGETLAREYRFDRKDGVLANYAPSGQLGPELIDMATALADSGATELSLNGRAASYTIVNTWGQRQLKVPVNLVAGKTYLFDVHSLNANRLTLHFPNVKDHVPTGWVQNDYYGAYYVIKTGANTVAVTISPDADTTGAHIGIASNGYDGLPGSVELSMRAAPGWGPFLNLAGDAVRRWLPVDEHLHLAGVGSVRITKFTGDGWIDSCYAGHDTVGNTVSIKTPLIPRTITNLEYLKTPFGYFKQVNRYDNQTEFAVPVEKEAVVLAWLRGEVAADRPIWIGEAIVASDLYQLRYKVDRLLKNKAGKVRPIPRFEGTSMRGEITPWTAANWEVQTCSQMGVDPTANRAVVGGASSGPNPEKFTLYTSTAKNARVQLPLTDGSATYLVTPALFETGKLETTKAWKLGDTAGLQLKETTNVGTRTDFEAIQVDRIGCWGTGLYWDGMLQYVLLIDLDDPLGNSRLYLMDTDNDILYDALAEDGPELTTGNIAKAGNCTLDGNTITNTNGGWGYLYEDVPVEVGEPYLITAAAEFVGEGDGWRLHVWENDNNVFSDTAKIDGVTDQVTALVTSSVPVIRVAIEYRGPAVGDQITKKRLSVRHKPNAGTIENPPADAFPQFVYLGMNKKQWRGTENLWNGASEFPLNATVKVSDKQLYPEREYVLSVSGLSEGSQFKYADNAAWQSIDSPQTVTMVSVPNQLHCQDFGSQQQNISLQLNELLTEAV